MKRIHEVVLEIVMVLALGLAAVLAAPRAHGEMITTEAPQAGGERARVKAMLERPEVAREMQKMGIPPEQAAARVDAMADAEVRQLAGRLEALPAGGALSTEQWLLVIIVVLLVLILI
jgi:hypothetical protein